ncbi:MAG: PPC domain-containing protein, partial [Methylococcales bacterium]|nr:PPC domain-containing protein [Methylococcales bacterium]
LFIFEENRGDCHPLIRDRIGSGGYPEASPSRSIGCAEGAYVPGDMIELTASPDPGWVIDHWIGTTSNDSKSVSNSFQMPDDDHAVTVVYRTVYYLPIITNNYTHYHSSPNEAEPNDSNNTANGSLISGNVYEGNFPSGNDMDDYYYFYLFNAGTVNISLTNIGAGHNYDLILRDKDGILMGYSGELDHNNEHITLTLPKEGVYFVRVFNRSATGSSQKYRLRVTHE